MFTLNCKGRLLVIDRPLVMGIMNITPDSFHEASRSRSEDAWLQTVTQVMEDGADLIDLGGQSTRPGSVPLSVNEELDRVVPAIELIHKNFPGVILSADTYYAAVARHAVAAGASVINDISAGSFDEGMFPELGRLKVPYVLSHVRGTATTMHQPASYGSLIGEMKDHFTARLRLLKEAGVNDIIIDPGFGFSKSISQNFAVLKRLEEFRLFGYPVLAGLSRKGTVYKTLGTSAATALNGSTVLHTIALMNGANILRVHDVKEAREAVTLHNAYLDAD